MTILFHRSVRPRFLRRNELSVRLTSGLEIPLNDIINQLSYKVPTSSDFMLI